MVGLFVNFATGLKHAPLPVSQMCRNKHTTRSIASMMSPQRCRLVQLRDNKTFELTLTGNDQHHLDQDLIDSIRSRLPLPEKEDIPGSVFITTAEGEYFCTGFPSGFAADECAEEFKNLVKDLICLPMPTIAAINGKTTGAGLMLAFCHDHLIMTPGSLLRSEHLFFGSTLPPYFAALLRSKVSSPIVRRDMVLREIYYDSEAAIKNGLVDNHGMDAEALAKELSRPEMDDGNHINGTVYADLRKAMLPDLCNLLGLSSTTERVSRL